MRALASLVLLLSALAWASPGWMRWAAHDDEGFTRFVFELPVGTAYATERSGALVRVTLGLSVKAPETLRPGDAAVERVELQPSAEGAEVRLYLRPGATAKKPFVLEGPEGRFRLVIDVLQPEAGRAAPPPKPKPPAPVVVIDPGHGGPDPGTVGYVKEKVVTLDIALRVKKILEARGIEVVLTRDGDYDLAPKSVKDFDERKLLDLNQRAKMTNGNRNLFVSIHVNSAERPARGIEVYYLGKTLDPRTLALAIAENGGGELGEKLTQKAESTAEAALADLIAQGNLQFSARLADDILEQLIARTGTKNRGVHSAPFYVLRYARIPAVLVEVGFANHPTEGRLLARADYRQKLAEGIAAGILEMLGNGAYAAAGR
ncbi:N-acetylmuramoyl-L-alanine amidase family protein [Oceanithermus desulfurans]|uniref:N-acetylmuramoyl-L-alanine amidase n=3 Tax=Oceanithermus TaxID=208447 RepID=A0A511RII7_9DEIN|nr:N-acetylmuramoyl-L-alanine amidase [Oceanithermus desulfurans]MBB6030667.1 N-acetylmuramoyl-L-alanine amidase [Oceanithermus desulfurans]GEM89454.1 N-acetylmuramoyl-L-alanine amidase [Oceanithermus desulfurans NBRC 100063]